MMFELLDQNGTPVLSSLTNQMTRRRHPGARVAPGEKKPKATPAQPTLWDAPAEAAISPRGNFFEDQRVGELRDLGAHTFGRDEIIAFARQFDPQPFHLDEAALRAAGQRLAAWGPSPGFRNLSWIRPVMAGDHIEFRNKTVELRELKSRPDRGLIVSLAEGRNQSGAIVYRFTGQIFVERRTRATASA